MNNLKKSILVIFGVTGFLYAGFAHAIEIPALTIENPTGENQTYSVSLQILFLMTILTVLPALVLTMTSFTRVIIVLGILRQAMGMPQIPSNQILIGLGLFLTFFIMAPIFNEVYVESIQPYMENKLDVKSAVESAKKPIKRFMLAQTRKNDIKTFHEMSNDKSAVENPDDVPFSVLMPAFVTSELKTAFQIGFLLFIPFLIIDLVVASVLMAMGMMMLSPLIISLPFKIMLFIVVDGWSLVMGTLANSFG